MAALKAVSWFWLQAFCHLQKLTLLASLPWEELGTTKLPCIHGTESGCIHGEEVWGRTQTVLATYAQCRDLVGAGMNIQFNGSLEWSSKFSRQ